MKTPRSLSPVFFSYLTSRTYVRIWSGGVRYVKSDRNFSHTAPAVAANPFIRSPSSLSAPLLWSLSLSFSLTTSSHSPPPFRFLSSSLSLAIGAAMYTPGRIYRPVFQPPCGGNGFRNAADTARPVLITIHTYCPHILPIPRALPLATDYITTYGEHKLLWLPFYRRPTTSDRHLLLRLLLRCLTTGHLTLVLHPLPLLHLRRFTRFPRAPCLFF